EAIVILTLALALSTRFAGMVGGVVALIFWGVAWIGGIVGGVGLVLGNETATHVGTVTRLVLPTDGMWRGAVWALEPATIIAAARRLRRSRDFSSPPARSRRRSPQPGSPPSSAVPRVCSLRHSALATRCWRRPTACSRRSATRKASRDSTSRRPIRVASRRSG